jgi:hypothetical protein
VSIFQNVDWVASLATAVCLVVIFAIVNVRLRLSLLRQRGETTVAGCVQRLTMWQRKDVLAN